MSLLQDMKIRYGFTMAIGAIASLSLLAFIQYDLILVLGHCQYYCYHGWNSDASVWSDWINDLNNTGIFAEAVAFGEDDPEYDACGSSADHAADCYPLMI